MKKIIRKFRDLKYRYKLTILMIAAGLIPVMIVSIYMQTGTLKMLRGNEENNLKDTLDQTVNTLDNQAEIYGNLINYLSYSQDLRKIIDTEFTSDYEAYLEYTEVADPLLTMPQIYHKEIQKITLYAENIKVKHGNTLAPLDSAEKEFWYPDLKSTEKVQWFVKRGSKRKIIASRKFFDHEKITAVLAVTLDYNRMLEPFSSLSKDNTGGTICDQHGDIVYSSYSMSEEYRPARAESVDYIKSHYSYSTREMEDTGWKFYLYRPTKVMTESANHLVERNFPILAICILLILLLGYWASRGMVGRLERLTENINRINLGSREVTVSSDSKDEVGVLIQQAAALNAVKCVLELGGKSAHVVFDDVDFKKAIPAIVKGIVHNTGQTCTAGSRLLLQNGIREEFLKALADEFSKTRAGTPEMDLTCGPVVNKTQWERINRYIQKGKDEGLVVVAEGAIAEGVPEGGYYVTPTIFGAKSHDSDLLTQEIFGPVLVVVPFDTEAQAIELANATDYGLMAGVWSENGGRQQRVARSMQVGQVYINSFGAGGGVELPFGGVKKSGHGREKGFVALEEMSTTKTIINYHG